MNHGQLLVDRNYINEQIIELKMREREKRIYLLREVQRP
jgi:hypothetical protein